MAQLSLNEAEMLLKSILRVTAAAIAVVKSAITLEEYEGLSESESKTIKNGGNVAEKLKSLQLTVDPQAWINLEQEIEDLDWF